MIIQFSFALLAALLSLSSASAQSFISKLPKESTTVIFAYESQCTDRESRNDRWNAPDNFRNGKIIVRCWKAEKIDKIFGDIDMETCSECGGDVRIVASIEDPLVIRMILDHLDAKGIHADLLPQCRAPAGIGLSP